MSGTSKNWVLVESRSGLDAAISTASDYGIVAGNAFIAGQLLRTNTPHVPGKAICDYDMALQAMSAADRDLTQIEPQIIDLPDPLRAISMAILARESMRHHALRLAATRLDGPLFQQSQSGLIPVTGMLKGTRDLVAAKPVCPTVQNGRQGRYILDFRSVTGQKLEGHQSRVWQPRISRRPIWQDQILNALAGFALRLSPAKPQALRLRLPQMPTPTLSELRVDSDYATTANAILHETSRLFFAAQKTMDIILLERGLPNCGIFNHVSDAIVAGFQSSLVNAGVPCEMSSHGALAAWGDGARHRVADHLSAIYNWFPGMTIVQPRARHLVSDRSAARLEVKQRLRTAQDRRDGPLRVYAAPNFRPWNEGFWGLTNTCFDTIAVLEALAAAIHKTPGTELFLRIKVTAKDLAKPGKRPANRGLFPEDVGHLITSDGPIHDASVGKHSELLEDADVVVTEGMTAVMFEALEMRRPVVLLVPDPRATPALPAARMDTLSGTGQRAAVYVANPMDDLVALLRDLQDLHLGRPLTDAEVAPYIWT